MSDKPHTVAIGAFVIGASLIGLATLLFLLGSGFGRKETVVMAFDGSVKGLNVGAPLALRGVKVGEVTDIEVVLESDNANVIMVVEASFDADKIRREDISDADLAEELISRGLRAQLNIQSLLTGLLYIELDFFPESPLNLAKIDSNYLQLPTIPTNLQRIIRKLEDIDVGELVEDLQTISNGIQTLVTGDDFQGLPANLTSTLDSVRELSTQLSEQLATTGPKLDSVLEETAVTVNAANEQLPRITSLIESNLKVLDGAIASFEKGMQGVDGLVSPDSATVYQLNNALQEMTRAGRSLQSLANTLEQQPESVIRGKRGEEE